MCTPKRLLPFGSFSILVFCLSLSIGVPPLKALSFAGKFPQLGYKIDEIEKSSGKEAQVALLPYKNFYEAEEYHQDYYLKNPEDFEKELIESGRKK